MFSICICYTKIINCSKIFTINIIHFLDEFGGRKQIFKKYCKQFFTFSLKKKLRHLNYLYIIKYSKCYLLNKTNLWTYSFLKISRELKKYKINKYVIGPTLSVKAITKNQPSGFFLMRTDVNCTVRIQIIQE